MQYGSHCPKQIHFNSVKRELNHPCFYSSLDQGMMLQIIFGQNEA